MTNCENCGKPLDHDFVDVGMCPHCLDNGGALDEDFSGIMWESLVENEDY